MGRSPRGLRIVVSTLTVLATVLMPMASFVPLAQASNNNQNDWDHQEGDHGRPTPTPVPDNCDHNCPVIHFTWTTQEIDVAQHVVTTARILVAPENWVCGDGWTKYWSDQLGKWRCKKSSGRNMEYKDATHVPAIYTCPEEYSMTGDVCSKTIPTTYKTVEHSAGVTYNKSDDPNKCHRPSESELENRYDMTDDAARYFTTHNEEWLSSTKVAPEGSYLSDDGVCYEYGHITLVKEVSGGPVIDPTSFQLNINTEPEPQNTPIPFQAGTYTVTENPQDNYIASFETCGDGGVINLEAGHDVTCTVTNTYDYCPNISDVQTSVPSGMIIDNTGACVTPPVDVCPNLAGDQDQVPDGYQLNDGRCMPVPVPSVCPEGTTQSESPLETVTVPSNDPNGGTSENDLANGTSYILKASDTWHNGGGIAASDQDAEYLSYDGWNNTQLDGDPLWVGQGWSNNYWNLLDLQVNNGFVNWGPYNSDHEYPILFSGTGAPVSFRVFDGDADTNTPNAGWYGDNTGNLSVDIYQCKPNEPLPAPCGEEDLQNGSVENGTDPGTYTTLNPGDSNMTNWTVDSGSVDYIGSYWQAAAGGTRSIDLNGLAAGSISQTIPTVVGGNYTVTFSLSGNPDSRPEGDPLYSPSAKVVAVSATGATPQDYTFDTTIGNSLADMMWQSETYTFVATGTSTTVTFVSQIPGAFGPALDNVSVKQDCEPAPEQKTITGMKFSDLDQNGTKSDNEPGLQGWHVWVGQKVSSYTVPAQSDNGTPIEIPTASLENGVTYMFYVSGTYGAGDATAGDPITADAKYSIHSPSSTWSDPVLGYESYGPQLLDLQVNDVSPDWGSFNASHLYSVPVTGTGEPVNLRIYDIYPQNNTGSLNVDVYKVLDGTDTDANGNYSLNMPTGAGTFFVGEVSQDGWTQTSSPNVYSFDDSRSVSGENFGNYHYIPPLPRCDAGTHLVGQECVPDATSTPTPTPDGDVVVGSHSSIHDDTSASDAGTPTPTPSPTPTATPPATGGEQVTPTPTPTPPVTHPGGGNGTNTPKPPKNGTLGNLEGGATPTPTPSPSISPSETPNPLTAAVGTGFLGLGWPWYWWLLILILLVIIYWYWRRRK